MLLRLLRRFLLHVEAAVAIDLIERLAAGGLEIRRYHAAMLAGSDRAGRISEAIR